MPRPHFQNLAHRSPTATTTAARKVVATRHPMKASRFFLLFSSAVVRSYLKER